MIKTNISSSLLFIIKMDNHLYTCWLFAPNVQQNVSICTRRLLLDRKNDLIDRFSCFYFVVIPFLTERYGVL